MRETTMTIEELADNWMNGNISAVLAAFGRMHPLDAASTALAVASYLAPESREAFARCLRRHAPDAFIPASPEKG